MPNGDKPPEMWEAADHIENLKTLTEDKEHSVLAVALVWVIRHMDLSEKKKPMLSVGCISIYSMGGVVCLITILLLLDRLGLSVFVN